MSKSEAVCTLEFKGDAFRFADVEQVRRSVARLQQDNIHESDEDLVGALLGVLPHRRTFEFQLADTAEIISGKVGKDIADPAAINQVLEQRVTVRTHSRRLGGGHPRFVLQSYRLHVPTSEPTDDTSSI